MHSTASPRTSFGHQPVYGLYFAGFLCLISDILIGISYSSNMLLGIPYKETAIVTVFINTCLLVNTMWNNCENHPSQFPKVQGDVIKCLVLFDQQFKTRIIQFRIWNRKKQQYPQMWDANTRECRTFWLNDSNDLLINENSCRFLFCQYYLIN